MNRFIRYFNQNRKGIITSIAVIAFFIIFITLLNRLWIGNEGKKYQNDVTDEPIKSVITGEKVSERTNEVNTQIIKKFVEYCNNGDYGRAYDLLTDECKDEYNNDKNIFLKKYIASVFSNKKTYEIELWLTEQYNYTYKITFFEDNLLATGGVNINKNLEDYITISKKNNEVRLSVNGLIKKEDINKSVETDDILIQVNSKIVYKNYEVYDMTIKNKKKQMVMLNKIENNGDLCLLDKDDKEYISLLDDLSQDDLILRSLQEKKVSIKFNKIYSSYSNKIEKIKFKKIVMDYAKYIQNPKDENIQNNSVEISIK